MTRGHVVLMLLVSFCLAIGGQARAEMSREDIREIQNDLFLLWIDPGSFTGTVTRQTEAAIRTFQKHRGLPEDGKATPALKRQLQAAIDEAIRASKTPSANKVGEYDKYLEIELPPSSDGTVSAGVIREIQTLLAQLGYDPGPVDGIMGSRTRWALQLYEADEDLTPHGEPTQQRLEHLKETAAAKTPTKAVTPKATPPARASTPYRPDRFSGTRSWTYPNGATYEGQWKNGLHNGHGIMTWPEGDRYAGDWKEGDRHGRGEYLSANGNRYVGKFEANRPHGQGEFFWSNGSRYIGDWIDGKRTGRGEQYNREGDRYTGDFVDNRFHGRGDIFWADGERYSGEFKNGKPWGQGVKLYADGRRYEGAFANASPDGQGTMTSSNGDRYVGGFKQGKYSGQGLYRSGMGGSYEGGFLNGLYHGEGTANFRNGDRYVGAWERADMHGYGTYWTAEGNWCAGVFENGYLVGWSTGVYGGRSVKCRHSGNKIIFFD